MKIILLSVYNEKLIQTFFIIHIDFFNCLRNRKKNHKRVFFQYYYLNYGRFSPPAVRVSSDDFQRSVK